MAKLNVEMSKTESKDKSLPYNEKFLVKNRYCVAKSGNDGVWYRAHIVEMLKTGVELEKYDLFALVTCFAILFHFVCVASIFRSRCEVH